MSRVAVIGGGVIGCAVAERLSLEGHLVTLLERDQLGARASGAAAGELSPSSRPGDHESLAMFPELVARIEKDSAMNVEGRGPRAALGLLDLARRLVPGLGQASLLRVWAGLRPITSRGEPIVARTDVSNVIVATGHHRKGILLAPLAAKQVADLISAS